MTKIIILFTSFSYSLYYNVIGHFNPLICISQLEQLPKIFPFVFFPLLWENIFNHLVNLSSNSQMQFSHFLSIAAQPGTSSFKVYWELHIWRLYLNIFHQAHSPLCLNLPHVLLFKLWSLYWATSMCMCGLCTYLNTCVSNLLSPITLDHFSLCPYWTNGDWTTYVGSCPCRGSIPPFIGNDNR